MVEIVLVASLGVLMLIGMLLFIGYKIYLHQPRVGKQVLVKYAMAAILIIIWGFPMPHQPPFLWQRILATFSAQYGLLLYYCGLDQMLNNKRVRPVLRSRAFVVTTLIVITVVIIDIRFYHQLSSYIRSTPHKLALIAYFESALNYVGLLYLELLIIRTYAKDLRRHSDPLYTCRRGCCMLAILVNFLGLLMLEGSLLFALLVTAKYYDMINVLYALSLLPMAVLIAGGYVLPDRFFTTVLRPIYNYLILRQKRQQKLLSYLHERILQVVPGIDLDCKEVRDLRVLIEISDAREVIWSQEPRTEPITPEDEAKHLLRLLRDHREFDLPGDNPPPPIRGRDIVKHNLAVATRLKRLEGTLPRKELVAVGETNG